MFVTYRGESNPQGFYRVDTIGTSRHFAGGAHLYRLFESYWIRTSLYVVVTIQLGLASKRASPNRNAISSKAFVVLQYYGCGSLAKVRRHDLFVLSLELFFGFWNPFPFSFWFSSIISYGVLYDTGMNIHHLRSSIDSFDLFATHIFLF